MTLAALFESIADSLEQLYDPDRAPIPPEDGSLPMGSTVYHGTGVNEGFDMPTGPAWFTDSVEVASEFIKSNATNRRVLAFEVIKRPTMLVFPIYQDVFAWLNSMHGTDIDYTYDAAKQICSMHHDGWILSHAYPGGFVNQDLEKGAVFTDIMLCNPRKFLRFAGEFEALDVTQG